MEKGKGVENKFKIDETMFFGKTFLKISLCDQGHYGLSLCGNSGYILSNKDSIGYCVKCNYEFSTIKRNFSSGGSDF